MCLLTLTFVGNKAQWHRREEDTEKCLKSEKRWVGKKKITMYLHLVFASCTKYIGCPKKGQLRSEGSSQFWLSQWYKGWVSQKLAKCIVCAVPSSFLSCASSSYLHWVLEISTLILTSLSPVISEALQHVISVKKLYEHRLRGAAPVLYVILVRKPRKLGPGYGLST